MRADIQGTWIARRSVDGYLWLMERAPKSTRGRLLLGAAIFLIAMVPSVILFYISLTTGQEATEAWFGRFGYSGVFLANVVGSATLFIPVPGLTASAQALIVSSVNTFSPFWLGVIGGLGMAVGEITAYVAGMATAFIATQEDVKPPRRLASILDRITRRVNWLMAHYGMPTLYVLTAIPNVFFEVAGLTAGATRYSFWKFFFAVAAGKITRGLLLAYVGEKLFFG